MTAPRHLVHVFATFDAGGPQVRTAGLIDALGTGYEHSILAIDGRLGCRERVPPARVRAWLEMPAHRLPALALGRFLLAQAPDLVLTYQWGAFDAVLGLVLRGHRRLLHHEEGFRPDEQVRQKARRVWARRLVLRRVAGVVVPSLHLERIARQLWHVPAGRLHYVPNAVDTARFVPGDREAARRRLDLPADALVIGSVGGLRPEKDYPLLLASFAALDDRRALLVLVGDGPQRAELETLARTLGVAERVRLPGRVEAAAGVYPAFDVFALSSTTEQMPISVLEAMACGLPVLATDVGDIAVNVGAENRAYIVPRDRYAAALRALAGDAPQRRRLGAANREHCARQYPLGKMIAAYRDLYEAAMAS